MRTKSVQVWSWRVPHFLLGGQKKVQFADRGKERMGAKRKKAPKADDEATCTDGDVRHGDGHGRRIIIIIDIVIIAGALYP